MKLCNNNDLIKLVPLAINLLRTEVNKNQSVNQQLLVSKLSTKPVSGTTRLSTVCRQLVGQSGSEAPKSTASQRIIGQVTVVHEKRHQLISDFTKSYNDKIPEPTTCQKCCNSYTNRKNEIKIN